MINESQANGANEEELSPIKLRIRAARRARAAIGLSTSVLLTIALGTAYRLFFHEHQFGIHFILLIGLIGLVLLNLGRTHNSRRMTELAILRFHTSCRFYGAVLSISAAVAFCYALTLAPKVEVKARTVEPSAPTPDRPVAPAPVQLDPPKQPDFPKLDLSGVILNGSRTSALINGQTVMRGDTIAGVVLVEIHENKVIVEKNGFRKTLSRFELPAAKPAKAAK